MHEGHAIAGGNVDRAHMPLGEPVNGLHRIKRQLQGPGKEIHRPPGQHRQRLPRFPCNASRRRDRAVTATHKQNIHIKPLSSGLNSINQLVPFDSLDVDCVPSRLEARGDTRTQGIKIGRQQRTALTIQNGQHTKGVIAHRFSRLQQRRGK